jgi:hypothetical protein
MLQSNVNYFVTRAFTEFGATDGSAIQNLNNAKKLGLRTDVYLNFCRSKDAVAQITRFLKDISASLYDNVWISVQKNVSPGCDWNVYSADSNCQYVQQMLSEVEKSGKRVGILSSLTDWQTIFRTSAGCYQINKYPLWFIMNDGIQSFNGFQPFGGWTIPSMKTYLTSYQMCGTLINLGFIP